MPVAEGTWGTGNSLIAFSGTLLSIQSDDQVIQGSRVNAAEIDRLTRKGQDGVRFADFTGGLSRVTGIGDVRSNLNQFALNQGLWTITPGLLYLPYNPTIQTSMTSDEDISAFTAANKRVHSLNTSLGVTGQRWLAGLGVKVLGDTSLTDSAVVVRDTFTDTILSAAVIKLNSVWYAAFGTNGATDDVKGTTSVTGSGAPTWVVLVALSAGDAVWAMQTMESLGPSGVTLFAGEVGGVNQLWYALGSASLPATLLPVVETSSKDIEGSLATTTTSATFPSAAAVGGIVGTAFNARVITATVGNITANDGAYCTQTFDTDAISVPGPYIYAIFSNQFTAVPLAHIITGIQVDIELKESNAAANIHFSDVHLEVNGEQVGINFADSAELGTVDTVVTMGGSTNRLGIQGLTGAQLQNIVLAFRLIKTEAAGTSRDVTIDYATLTITHRAPGTAIVINQGGCRLEPFPNMPNRMVMLEPPADDETAITKPRRLLYIDTVWDSAGNRPTATKTYPNVGGLTNIHHGCPALNGYIVTGGPTSGPGVLTMILREDGKVVNTRMPSNNGSTVFKCNGLAERNGFIVAQMVASDNTDLQYWLLDLNTNQWHTPTVLQSKTATAITTQPIPYAEFVLGQEQNRIYSLWPNSTDTGVRREFMPPDPNADPRLSNTSEVKFASALYLQTMEMFAGYPDASNTILRLDYHERRIGTSSSATGTVLMQIETGGDAAFTSPAVNPAAFTAGLHATPSSRGFANVASGQPYQTIIARITLDQGTGTTTSSPNGVPWLLHKVQNWADELLTIDVQLDPSYTPQQIYQKIREFETNRLTKNVQRLKIGEMDLNASFEKVIQYREYMGMRGATAQAADILQPPVLRFATKIGSTA